MLLCGCGSGVERNIGENFIYISDGTYYFWSPSGERDLGNRSDSSYWSDQQFYTDGVILADIGHAENRLEICSMPFNKGNISTGETAILSDTGKFTALTERGLYYENEEGELWFTDFYTNALVCKSYDNTPNVIGSVNPIVLSASGANAFVVYNGELHEYKMNYDEYSEEYGRSIVAFSDSIIDRGVIGIWGDRQHYGDKQSYDGELSEVGVTSDSIDGSYTNLYYWKKDDNFDIFDYYMDENNGDISVSPSDFDGMDKSDPAIHEQWQRAMVREQFQSFNESDESVCKVMYYDAAKQSTEVAAGSVFISEEMYVYENGEAFASPFIISLDNIDDYQFSFMDMRNNSFVPLSIIGDRVYDRINKEGIRGYMLFDGEKIPFEYQCDGDYMGKSSGGMSSSGELIEGCRGCLGGSGLYGSRLCYDFTNHNLYQFVRNEEGNYDELLCFSGDESGTINYNTPKVMNTSMGVYNEDVYVHTITNEGIIYSVNHSTEDFSTGQCSGILYCNDDVLLDTGNLYTVMTAQNKSYVESKDDRIYEIDDGKLRSVIDKPATLIHVDRRCDETFDYVLNGCIYRWANNESNKMTSNPISLEDEFGVTYLIGRY